MLITERTINIHLIINIPDAVFASCVVLPAPFVNTIDFLIEPVATNPLLPS